MQPEYPGKYGPGGKEPRQQIGHVRYFVLPAMNRIVVPPLPKLT